VYKKVATVDPRALNAAVDAKVAAAVAGIGIWQSYVPAWTASAGTPALVNGTLAGRYCQIGKVCHVVIDFTAGSSTTFGTAGNFWRFGLPPGLTAAALSAGSAYAENAGVLAYPSLVRMEQTTSVMLYDAPNGVSIGATTPFTWAVGDFFNLQVTYEVA
jgi:hypothetical protein